MSRSQQSSIYDTGKANSGTDQTNADNALTTENADIGDYQTQLAKFAASNPYTEGGEYQTDQNKTLSSAADVGSSAITNQVQTQSARTGQNAGAAVATAAEAARANQRGLSSAEGDADATRIGNEAGYNDKVLGASEVPAQLEAGEYATSLGAANGALNTAGTAAQTPGFWDEIGNSFAKSLGQAPSKIAQAEEGS